MAGTIKSRGKDSHRITWDVGRSLDGRRIRRTETVRGPRKDAEARLIQRLSERDQGIDVEPNRLTVEQFLDHWLKNHNVTEQSKARYQQSIRRHVLPTIGTVRLQRLKPLQVQEVLTRAELTTSASTAHDVCTILNMALAQAVRWQLIPRNPALAVERPGVTESEAMRILTPQEIHRLFEASRDSDLYLVIVLALDTGVRRGEALALKWPNVDLERGTIAITESARYAPGIGVVYGSPKSRKSRRTIALSGDTLTLLKEHRKAQLERRLRWGPAWADHADLVFTNEVGEPIPIGSFNARFTKIAKKAGLTPLRFHDLRHTHGTLLAGAGINPKVISDRLGHSDVKFTLNRYVTPTEDHQRAAAETFANLLKSAR